MKKTDYLNVIVMVMVEAMTKYINLILNLSRFTYLNFSSVISTCSYFFYLTLQSIDSNIFDVSKWLPKDRINWRKLWKQSIFNKLNIKTELGTLRKVDASWRKIAVKNHQSLKVNLRGVYDVQKNKNKVISVIKSPAKP